MFKKSLLSPSLVHFNIVNKSYQQDSRASYKFVLGGSFGQLLEISPPNFISLRTYNEEFLYIEVWFTDQNSSSLEIEDRINLTLVIK